MSGKASAHQGKTHTINERENTMSENTSLSPSALPGNPFAVVVDGTAGDNARNTAALMAVAYELRTQNLMEARRMGAYDISEEEVAERIGGRTEAELRFMRDGEKA